MKQRIVHQMQTVSRQLKGIVIAFFAVATLASSAAFAATPETLNLDIEIMRNDPEVLSDLSNLAPSKQKAVELVDAATGATYTALYDEEGAIFGWMNAAGATYDTRGNLIAMIDGVGNVVAVDGSVMFDLQAKFAQQPGINRPSKNVRPDFHVRWNRVYFNRRETAALDNYGMFAVGPLCSAIAAATGGWMGAACGLGGSFIIAVAKHANRRGMCVGFSVSYWALGVPRVFAWRC